MLTYDPVTNPKKPRINRHRFLKALDQEHLSPCVTVSKIAGAINANVELDTAPTKDINKSSLGIAAAKAKVSITRLNLKAYSAFRWFSGIILR